MFIELIIDDVHGKKNILVNVDQIESITPGAFNPKEETYIQLKHSSFIVKNNYEMLKNLLLKAQ